jgi:hypothetical protein
MDKRILLATAILAMFSEPAFADTRDDVMAGMQRCRAFPDDRTWLECTYGAQQPMRAKLGLQPAPDYQQRLVPPATSAMTIPPPVNASPPMNTAPRPAAVRSNRKPSFMQILTGTAAPVAVSTVTSVEYGANNAFQLGLENGQTWRQVNADGAARARFKPGTKVTIKPGAMGSYNLLANGHTYKVEQKS